MTTTNASTDCGVCLEPLENGTSAALVTCAVCKNETHYECWMQWLEQKGTCVYCRTELDKTLRRPPKLHAVDYDQEEEEEEGDTDEPDEPNDDDDDSDEYAEDRCIECGADLVGLNGEDSERRMCAQCVEDERTGLGGFVVDDDDDDEDEDMDEDDEDEESDTSDTSDSDDDDESAAPLAVSPRMTRSRANPTHLENVRKRMKIISDMTPGDNEDNEDEDETVYY